MSTSGLQVTITPVLVSDDKSEEVYVAIATQKRRLVGPGAVVFLVSYVLVAGHNWFVYLRRSFPVGHVSSFAQRRC